MTEYVIDPEAAQKIVTDTETKAEDAAEYASQLEGAIDRLEDAFNGTFVGGHLVNLVRRARSNSLVALARVDNATGAGAQVITLLESADVAMASQSASTAEQLRSDAAGYVSKGVSKE